ncbi:guanine deaminase [Alteromonas lipolytica]|uniref:Guanine deaminase n=1 Tax=Alteromonas lipolytica TaxID=1856405 RepID=A0A1E8FK93_9ALTE|nr:guanine deaminase [Alteromonas lipolytica]OFI36369.1 guanine deaminase [Alteromonas lipolytica]GGF70475.1 guanine deaminase [Alteromonas lipolytica]
MQLIRGAIHHYPTATTQYHAGLQSFADGGLLIEDGKISDIGDFSTLKAQYPDAGIVDYSGKVIIPGLIDTHLHFPQTEIIASYGEQLLTWLDNFTFPTERRFEDETLAAQMAEVFLTECLKNGTTTGLVYSSVHKVSTEALFRAASARNMLTVAGKVCMDRHCPEWLQDTPESAQRDSAELIEQWHGKGRNYYALTPRFAPTSTREQMAALGELAQQYDDVFIQTHLSENHDEIAWVKTLYPECQDYLAVYEKYHMLRPRAVYGHCIHLSDSEWQRMADSGAVAAFCPTSNLFLGSGLFDMAKADEFGVPVTLATDVGGGTSFNLLKTLGEAYKICQLRNYNLSSLQGFYMLTQGAAVSLGLNDRIGNLNPGSDADFVVINPRFDPLSQLRIGADSTCEDTLFALTMLGDDRATVATYVAGQPQYQQQEV